MNPVVVLVIFVGAFMVVHGIYEEKLKRIEKDVKVEYRFLPRTLYDEQIAGSDNVQNKFKGMFDTAQKSGNPRSM